MNPSESNRIYLVTDTSWWLEEGYYITEKLLTKKPDIYLIIPQGAFSNPIACASA